MSGNGSKLDRYGPIVSWLTGIIVLFMALVTVTAGSGVAGTIRGIIGAIVLVAVAGVLIPPVRRLIVSRSGDELGRGAVIGIVLLGLVVGFGIAPTLNTPEDGANGDGPEDGLNGDGSPADTSTAEPNGESAETNGDQQRIQQVAAETFSDYGLMAGISPDGRYAAFGLHTGDFMVYDAETDSFESHPTGIGWAPSHIHIQNDGSATVAYMDAEMFGGIDFTTDNGMEWAVEYGGLWDIDPNTDHSAVAAVTYPDEGPGRVGVVTGEGEVQWDEPIEDAASESVAMTNDGNRVAVGAIEYWTDSLDTGGTPGIRLYDGETGEELWSYETDTETWVVDIHGEQELVAAVTDEQLLVLDFDGNVVWEQDNSGSAWVAISDDGSTVATIEGGTVPVAYEAETGEQRWRADDAPGLPDGHRIALSADGDRLIATETVGWTYVVNEGEVIWQEEREENPANVAISADGTVWSIIVQDNETGEAHVTIYRDNDPNS